MLSNASTWLGVGALLAALSACGRAGPPYDPDSPEGKAYVYRHAVMELADAKARLLAGMAREELTLDEPAFVKAAVDLAALSTMMIDGFENRTLVDESRTDPSVWENWDDFRAKLDGLIKASAQLEEAATSQGFAAARELVQPTLQHCGSCHRPYRLPEAE